MKYEDSTTRKFEEGYDMHRNLALAENYARPNKKGEYPYVSGVMGIAYNPFLNSEAGSAHRNHEVTELLKFWTEKIILIDSMEGETESRPCYLRATPKVIGVPRSSKRVELRMGNENGMMTYEFRNGLEIVETLLVSTSPCELD